MMSFCVIEAAGWLKLESFWRPAAEHVWQSTLFGVVVALLTLLLKKNRAQTRYVLWLIASVKFLIPYAVLVAAGNYFSWIHAAGAENPGIAFLIRGPFGAGAPAATDSGSWVEFAARVAPGFFLAVWAMGAAAVFTVWWLRWQRTARIVGQAAPLSAGREYDALRGIEQAIGMKRRMRLVCGAMPLEPGVSGLFRPVLFLPAGIPGCLTQEQLEAILSHELCHVRRRDNLTAALHLLVEAGFWFHPLVWWIGARMMEERERACDEEVLARGSDPQIYAESILKVCAFRLEALPVLMAGVTGTKLKERIEAIMSKRQASKLDVSRRVFLTAMGVAAVVGPVAAGALSPRENLVELKLPGATQSVMRFVLGDIKIEGDVHDREGIQGRILKAWRDREYDDITRLADSVMQEGVRGEFQNRGYFKAVASDPVSQRLGVSNGIQSIRLVTSVQEGAQFRLGTLGFQNGDPGRPLSIPAETLREQIHLRTGDVLNVSVVHEGIARIKKLYEAKNSAAEVTPEVSIDDERQIISAIFRVKEGTNAN